MFGISTFSVKAAMLFLWAIGVTFFYLTLAQLNTRNKWLPFLITAAFICAPAWFNWALKARGGYITASTCSFVILFLLFHKKLADNKIVYASIGILLSLTYQSHIIFILLPLSFIFYRYLDSKDIRRISYIVIPFVILNVLFYFYKKHLPDTYHMGINNPFKRLERSFSQLPSFTYRALHGNYEFDETGIPGFFQRLFSYEFIILICSLLGIGTYRFFSEKYYLLRFTKKHLLFCCGVLSVGLFLASTFFSFDIQPRYLLGIVGATLFTLFLFLDERLLKRVHYAALLLLIITGYLATLTFRQIDNMGSNVQSAKQVLNYLNQNDVHYVFTENDMLGWQLMFYSNEQTIARPPARPGRYAPYTKLVNEVYLSGKKTAAIGFLPTSAYYHSSLKRFKGPFVHILLPGEPIDKEFEF
ncbi:MAG: hypothetical protein JNL72_00300 [Flavipsychrobacter sp.]|nr:hypothetical protein [Flavipsychrobacter sp.]